MSNLDKVKQWWYYILIGIISFISLVFLPMVGSDINLGWKLPNTFVGWLVWIVTRLIVSILNILIFHCFMCQAKVNVKDNEEYKKANEILLKIQDKEALPRSPKKWNLEQYGRKGTTLFLASVLSTFALTQAILTFNWIYMLSVLFTLVMGLIFGLLQMKNAEEYWTVEYYKYALLRKQQDEEAEEEERQHKIEEERQHKIAEYEKIKLEELNAAEEAA